MKYWDKTATKYEFFAAAPSTADWKFVGESNSANQHASYFMMENAQLAATNFVSTPTTTHIETFKGLSGDTDWLIADKCPVGKNDFNSTYTVPLNFIHILSRLNIIVKKSSAEDPVTTLKSIKVKGLNLKGTFNENLSSANTSGLTKRWTTASPAVTTTDYDFIGNFDLEVTNNYVLQSLVIPQEVEYQDVKTDGTGLDGTDDKAYIEIIYEITGETFKAYYNLAEIFGAKSVDDPLTAKVENKAAFNEGWENTLTITIAPDIINFTSGVAEWSTNGATENIE